MASIDKRKGKDETTFRVSIRRKGVEIFKSFKTEEDAKLYAFYKERLIDNMEAFEVPLGERITLTEIFDLKINSINGYNRRTFNDLDMSFKKCKRFLPNKKYYHQFTEADWLECAKQIYAEDSWKGSKENKIKISPITLRRVLANVSAAVSHCISLGIALDNLPLKIIQTFVNPMIKTKNSQE